MRPIAIAGASALLGAAALLAWLLRDPPGPSPESNAGDPDERAPTASMVAPDKATPINSASSLAARTASPSVYVQALAAGSLQPLTQASLTLLSGTDYPPTLVALPVSHADDLGSVLCREILF
jgi:hypothetical protein